MRKSTRRTSAVPGDALTDAGLAIVAKAYEDLIFYARNALDRGTRQRRDPRKARHDQPLQADIVVEENAFIGLGTSSFGAWMAKTYQVSPEDWIFGEESLDDTKIPVILDHTPHPVALLDMLDGSRLWALQLSNWCAAVLFTFPAEGRILGAFLADALGRLYFATDFRPGAFRIGIDVFRGSKGKWRGKEAPVHPLRFRTEDRKGPTLRKAYVGWVGQRRERLRAVASHVEFLEVLDPDTARLFNLGGNPMLTRVADGGIDLVFELKGQKPHDALPGLYTALKAGARAFSLQDGEEVTLHPDRLRSWLLRPKNAGISYVVGATRALALEAKKHLWIKSTGYEAQERDDGQQRE